ncbi:replication-relaxation family protein [Streptomyces sp. NPDC049040]|uniref:replication-relaxation family protein n=1 Tax=Streptomyces sp. NPDC049040 TaxID=3365593 RepID=UPI00371F0496
MGGLEAWRTEVPHPLTGSGKRNVRADAMFQDKAAGVRLLMVEVDRATEPAHVLADKAGSYADCYARRVRPLGLPGPGRGTIGEMNTVPSWETLCPRTGLSGLPPVAIVLTGAGPTALANRMRAVAGLSCEFWAGTEHAGYSHPDDGGSTSTSPPGSRWW